jgi:hypothetical protein
MAALHGEPTVNTIYTLMYVMKPLTDKYRTKCKRVKQGGTKINVFWRNKAKSDFCATVQNK